MFTYAFMNLIRFIVEKSSVPKKRICFQLYHGGCDVILLRSMFYSDSSHPFPFDNMSHNVYISPAVYQP